MISCVCLTYGRPHVLAQAVESFKRQDYQGPAELVIVNDYAEQKLQCSVPGVRCVNLPERVLPLGRKYNQAIWEHCDGDYIAIWEDDDIFLPWRLSVQMDALRAGNPWHHTGRAWFEAHKGELYPANNLHHSALAFSRAAFEDAGGYPQERDHCSLDKDLMHRLGVCGNSLTLDWERVYYIYRWQHTGSYHGSATQNADMGERARIWVEQRNPQKGTVEIEPSWELPWDDMARKAARHVRH